MTIALLIPLLKDKDDGDDFQTRIQGLGPLAVVAIVIIIIFYIVLFAKMFRCVKTKKTAQARVFEVILYIILGPFYYFLNSCSK